MFSDIDHFETIVIHTAGIINISDEDDIVPQMYAVNVLGTENVVEQCRRHQVKRLVYVSSVHAIPEADSLSTIVETSVF